MTIYSSPVVLVLFLFFPRLGYASTAGLATLGLFFRSHVEDSHGTAAEIGRKDETTHTSVSLRACIEVHLKRLDNEKSLYVAHSVAPSLEVPTEAALPIDARFLSSPSVPPADEKTSTLLRAVPRRHCPAGSPLTPTAPSRQANTRCPSLARDTGTNTSRRRSTCCAPRASTDAIKLSRAPRLPPETFADAPQQYFAREPGSTFLSAGVVYARMWHTASAGSYLRWIVRASTCARLSRLLQSDAMVEARTSSR